MGKLVVGVALVLGCSCLHAATLVPYMGDATPSLVGRTIAGEPFDLSKLKGRTVLVNFWATWCAPCVAEMPSLQRIRERLRIEVIAVNLQENELRIRAFLDQHSLAIPALRDHDGSVRARWRVTVFPSTFVVAPDGRIALVATGEVDWDNAGTVRTVDALTQATVR